MRDVNLMVFNPYSVLAVVEMKYVKYEVISHDEGARLISEVLQELS
jgi:hypothetical protein